MQKRSEAGLDPNSRHLVIARNLVGSARARPLFFQHHRTRSPAATFAYTYLITSLESGIGLEASIQAQENV